MSMLETINSAVEFTREQERIQRGMYGMTEAQLDRMIATQSFEGRELLFACGLLSDCQEVLSHSDCDEEDEVRKMLNQAKYIFFKYMEQHNIR